MTVRGPLKIKRNNGQETVFGTQAVKSVVLKPASPGFVKLRPDMANRWWVEVNDITVFDGTEKGARRVYERALRYVR